MENYNPVSGRRKEFDMLMMKKRKITRNTFSPANAGFHYNYSDSPARRCKSVVLSSRAYSSILAEAYANGSNESGGILLGHNDLQIDVCVGLSIGVISGRNPLIKSSKSVVKPLLIIC